MRHLHKIPAIGGNHSIIIEIVRRRVSNRAEVRHLNRVADFKSALSVAGNGFCKQDCSDRACRKKSFYAVRSHHRWTTGLVTSDYLSSAILSIPYSKGLLLMKRYIDGENRSREHAFFPVFRNTSTTTSLRIIQSGSSIRSSRVRLR